MNPIVFVVTARPSYSRIRPVLSALHERGEEFLIFPAASSLMKAYGDVFSSMAGAFWDHLGPCVHCVKEGDLLESVQSTSRLMEGLAGLLYAYKPSKVVTIADRHETIATAVAASYQNIPLVHLQGGETTGSIDDRVRNAVTALADVHLVATEAAERRVLEIKPGAEVYNVGCPSLDLASEALRQGPLSGPEVVVLHHPVTDEIDQARDQIRALIGGVEMGSRSAWWFSPGEDAGGLAMREEIEKAGIKCVGNKNPVEFLRILLGSGCIVGNSSVGIRECSYLGVPAVNIGSRQKGRERGLNVMDVPHDAWSIGTAIDRLSGTKPQRSFVYGDGRSGPRIADLLTASDLEEVA